MFYYNGLPSCFNPLTRPKHIYYLNCNKHGKFVGTGSRNNCPICLEHKNNLCINCGKHKKYKPFKYCLHCLKKDRALFNYKTMHRKAKDTDKDEIIYSLKCKKHGIFLTLSNSTNCPKCFPHKCKICGSNKNVISKLDICQKCFNEMPKTDNLIDLLEENNYNLKNIDFFQLTCDLHGNYLGRNSRSTCPYCAKKGKSVSTFYYEELLRRDDAKIIYRDIHYNDCKKNVEILTMPIVEDSKYKKHYSTTKCLLCGREFVKNATNQKFCGFCYRVGTCEYCGDKFVTLAKKIPRFCSCKCSSKYRLYNGNNKGILALKYKRIRPFYSFNRIKIDNNLLKDKCCIDLDNIDDVVKNSNDSFVWIKVDIDEMIILDVLSIKGSNFKSEIIYHYKEVKNKEKFKYKEMADKNIKFYLIESCSKWDDALDIECDLAIKYNAKLWSPCPAQLRKVTEYLSNNSTY